MALMVATKGAGLMNRWLIAVAVCSVSLSISNVHALLWWTGSGDQHHDHRRCAQVGPARANQLSS